MSRNGYLSVARLASHPAFCGHHCVSLHCPVCDTTFQRSGEYDQHFLGHSPSRELAYEKLSGRTFDREEAKGRWSRVA